MVVHMTIKRINTFDHASSGQKMQSLRRCNIDLEGDGRALSRLVRSRTSGKRTGEGRDPEGSSTSKDQR